MKDALIYYDNSQLTTFHTLGGKAANLLILNRAGFPIPPWCCLTTTFFQAQFPTPSEQQIKSFEFSNEQKKTIAEALQRLGDDNTFFAVRSSASDEDSLDASFAGLHDSFLYVKGLDNILLAIKNVWLSLFNERALSYRQHNMLQHDQLAIAVIIQTMVGAKSSGVMFSVDPIHNNVHHVLINSVYGCGEGLVSQGLDADSFVVDKTNLELVSQDIAEKKQCYTYTASTQSLMACDVAQDLQKQASLNNDVIAALADYAINIEEHYYYPQDIEFAVDSHNKIYILQARPITTLHSLGPALGHELLWDNSNIVESYSGVTTPLTFSFIKRAYRIVYLCFADVMGISPNVIKDNQTTFANMLGLIRGQVYYNLYNWYKLVRLFPGFNINKRFMESMMGVKQGTEMQQEVPWYRRFFIEAPALLKLLSKTLWNFSRIKAKTKKFNHRFNHFYSMWMAMDFNSKRPHELLAIYNDMEKELLWHWQTPIINDFFVMIFYGTLKSLCQKWCHDENNSLQNDLLSGEGGIESTMPAKRLLMMAREAYYNNDLKLLFSENTPKIILNSIEHDPAYQTFKQAFHQYLEDYGFRCVNELKLESDTLRDNPEFVIQLLKNYLNSDDDSLFDLEEARKRELHIRLRAEQAAKKQLKRHKLYLIKAPVFKFVLKAARLGVKNRENLRFARTKIYGLLRELLRALGAQLAADDLITERQDIFYLSIDEIWDFIQGTSVTTNLKGLIALRQQEFSEYQQPEHFPDDRFFTHGMVYGQNGFKSTKAKQKNTNPYELQGTPCCPGKLSGKVKIIRDPTSNAELNGEILVAERTDPGWVPLYPAISGLLIERGSILSHSAIVAREMGIPTIVGIDNLLSTLKEGEEIEMDGAAGIVRRSQKT